MIPYTQWAHNLTMSMMIRKNGELLKYKVMSFSVVKDTNLLKYWIFCDRYSTLDGRDGVLDKEAGALFTLNTHRLTEISQMSEMYHK